MPYKLAVIDDNPTDIEYITSLTKKWADSATQALHIEPFPSAEAFLFAYEADKAWDILLLDIEMGGQNGVELAKAVRQTGSAVQIVFITGFPDFIAEGYEVSALHYLMKPVSFEKLSSVLDRAADSLSKAEKRLRVTFDRQTDLIPQKQILYIEAQKQYVLIHTAGETYRMKSTLSDVQKELDVYFYKCQRSFLVNLQYVKRIKNDCVLLTDGTEIPISRGLAEAIGKEIIRLF